MPVKRRISKQKKGVSELAWAFINDAPLPKTYNTFELSDYEHGGTPELEALWRQHSETSVKNWVKHSPGTRPRCWWRYESPEPRKRLGGIGRPMFWCERKYPQGYSFGIPWPCWSFEQFKRLPGYIPIDPENPPVFESQAAYLERLGFLLPGEKRRITQSMLKPVVLNEAYFKG
ncbi:MAG: hypothetical protein OEZ68_04230 [Gammaproteobacteria bacterium]|nr:hypothetical protein [Gammaproteobacteria bacterium]MDH5799995.1 hypothetical protein [Gammaproteobacteria bacterium]